MYKQILINVEAQEKRVAILESNALEEFYVERADQQRLVGNIYKGRVNAILPGMAAAFIDIGLEKNGFMHVSDIVETPPDIEELFSESTEHKRSSRHKKESMPQITNLLKKGQELLVQIVKEPIGTKGARLTTHVSLPGRLIVYMPHESRIGVSKRIKKDSERARIKRDLASLGKSRKGGFIARTAGIGCGRRAFAAEVNYLSNVWEKVKRDSSSAKAPSLIHREHDLALRVVRDLFTKDVNRLIVDDKEEFRKIARFIGILNPSLRLRLKYYRGETPLFERFGIEKEIDKIYENRIYLKNKGYIIIEQTESLVAIDVNTGGYVGRKSLEETAFNTNLEAAREISRQMRLRDMGGIIVIDFIDMEAREHRQRVFETLKESLRRDKAKTKVLNISALGLVEMTRQRMRKSVESLSYKICPYCNGRGSVKSVVTVSIEAKRELAHALKKQPRKRLVLYIHPDVHRHLLTVDRSTISALENRYRRKVILRENPAFHIEQIVIDSLDK